MDVQVLTAVETADVLDAAWLADRLDDDEDLRAETRDARRDSPIADGCNVDETESWLNVEFVQTRPNGLVLLRGKLSWSATHRTPMPTRGAARRRTSLIHVSSLACMPRESPPRGTLATICPPTFM